MKEADLWAVGASLDDYADCNAHERDAVNARWFVTHTKNLLDEVLRLRAIIKRHDIDPNEKEL